MKTNITKRVPKKRFNFSFFKNTQEELLLTFRRIAFYTISNSILGFILSSYLSEYLTPEKVGLVFLIPNLISCLVILFLGEFVRKRSLFKVTIINTTIIFFTLITQIPQNQNIYFIVIPIIIYQIALMVGNILFDYYIENYSTDDTTGDIKGKQWTVVNFMILLGPVLSGLLIKSFGFNITFGISALFLLGDFLILYKYFRKTAVNINAEAIAKINLKKVFKHKSITKMSITHLILSLFYSWMTIYIPIYMNTVLNLSWDKIGLILGIILIPFVIIQYPAGQIADKHLGEKELLITGGIIMVLSTTALFWASDVLVFTVLLFMTRVGASLVEIMRDVHFYKNVSCNDLDMISFFKLQHPLGYAIGPLIGTIVLTYLDMRYLFLILGALTSLFVFINLNLKDSK
ncbi:MFS transporter [Patescibacteria group bacterium]|nr:MFS transporter [Patescibacteria group bacterium]